MPVAHASSFHASALFRNGHFATIYPNFFRRVKLHYSRRCRYETSDQDFYDVDVVDNGSSRAMILLHGLEGSSSSGYIKSTGAYFSALGFDVHALNFRSCSGEPNRQLRSYHSGFTDDAAALLRHLAAQAQYDEIYMCGFSLGGNVLLKLLAERAGNLPVKLKAAAAVSVPADLRTCALRMAKAGNRVYMRRFLKSLTGKIRVKAAMFPGLLNLEGLDKLRDFQGFDNRYTAPIHGFADAAEYWALCSSVGMLHKIQTPVLLVNAKDDPFLAPEAFPTDAQLGDAPVFAEYPVHGGHVGFMSGFFGGHWIEPRIHTFFKQYF